FLVGLIVVGMLVVPRAIRAVRKLARTETMVIFAIGLRFGATLLADALGYSIALSAFIAGSLIAESGHGAAVEHLVQPIRDLFAAIFFVSVGMLIDPKLILEHGVEIGVLCGVVILGKTLSVTTDAFLTDNGTQASIQAGMSQAQIGEFAFIIA